MTKAPMTDDQVAMAVDQNTEDLHRLYDLTVTTLLLNGMNPNFKVGLVMLDPDTTMAAVVGSLTYEQIEAAIARLKAQNAAEAAIATDALERAKRGPHG
jgi:hypothetical protein